MLASAGPVSGDSSLQTALQMEGIQTTEGRGAGGNVVGTKRRKREEGAGGSEPRRLRRSHEACARCRGKKIKCDSKHPRCTACVTAGTQCNQEDRHRQTLTPRGHTERLEQLLAGCEALLKRHLPAFDIEQLDDILARERIVVQPTQPPPQAPQQQQQPPPPPPPPPAFMPPPGYPVMPPYHPGLPYHQVFQYPPPAGPYLHHLPPPSLAAPPPPPPPPPPANNDIPPGQDPRANDMSNTHALAKSFGVAPSIVGDLSTHGGHLDREDLAVGSSGLDSGRDRAVLELTAPRDTAKWRTISVHRAHGEQPAAVDIWLPRNVNTVHRIVEVYFARLNFHRPVFFRAAFERQFQDLYAERANYDPGFICSFYLILALGTLSEANQGPPPKTGQDEKDSQSDPSPPRSPLSPRRQATVPALPPDWPEHDEFFERALSVKPELRVTLSSLQALILLHWYLYAERQGRALWRLVGSLVRLAIELGLHHDPTTQTSPNPNPSTSGNPLEEVPTFTEEECQLRIRLWAIVLVHDRGTSILLGRPLAIAPSDANTPRPARPRGSSMSPDAKGSPSIETFSEHFLLSAPIAEIQADIINSLYSPTRQSGDTIMRNATRIIKSMAEFRRSLPDRYKFYFSGTDSWTLQRKTALIESITEDEGLTLLKLGISRILLLRALFSLKELSYPQRRRALIDAIITSHNIIAIHTILIRFSDIAFFTSPIPLHIAAMVILYGRMSKCDEKLELRTQMEDVWLALDMLPRFRWRDTKLGGAGNNPGATTGGSGWTAAGGGANPLIAKLAERVMEVSLGDVNLMNGLGAPGGSSSTEGGGVEGPASPIGRIGPVGQPVLMGEPEWEEETNAATSGTSGWTDPALTAPAEVATTNARSPTLSQSQVGTPTLQASSPFASQQQHSPHVHQHNHHPAAAAHHSHQYVTPSSYGPQTRSAMNANPSSSSSSDKRDNAGNGTGLVEVPQSLFYPFYPNGAAPPANSSGSSSSSTASNGATNGNGGEYQQIFAAAAQQQLAQQDSYMSEERDMVTHSHHHQHVPHHHHSHHHQTVPPPPPPGHQGPHSLSIAQQHPHMMVGGVPMQGIGHPPGSSPLPMGAMAPPPYGHGPIPSVHPPWPTAAATGSGNPAGGPGAGSPPSAGAAGGAGVYGTKHSPLTRPGLGMAFAIPPHS